MVLFNAAFVSSAIVVVTGIILLLAGAAQIALGFYDETADRKWLSVLLGVLTLLLGWAFLSNPLSGVISLTSVLLILIAVSGVIQIMLAYRARGTSFFAPFLVAGLLSVVLAAIILLSPTATMSLLGILLGLHMLAVGACLLMMGSLAKTLSSSTD